LALLMSRVMGKLAKEKRLPDGRLSRRYTFEDGPG